jgi:hypothetical protein
LNQTKELEAAGSLTEAKTYRFEWENVERNNETYFGVNASLHYYVRVVIARSLNMNISKQVEFFQRLYQVSNRFRNDTFARNDVSLALSLSHNSPLLRIVATLKWK